MIWMLAGSVAVSLYLHSFWPVGLVLGTIVVGIFIMGACGELNDD